MSDICRLREANGLPDQACEEQACIFWRAVGHLGEEVREGCAIEHFRMIGNDGIAQWLMSVKSRIEDSATPRLPDERRRS